MVGLLPPAAGRGVQLERPQEVGGIPEVGSDGKDFVDEVLDTDEVVLAQVGLNKVVGGDGRPAVLDLGEPALVDELADALDVWGAPSHVRLCKSKESCFIAFDKSGGNASEPNKTFGVKWIPKKYTILVILISLDIYQ